MANNNNDSREQDFSKVIQQKNSSSGLAFLHQQNTKDVSPIEYGKTGL